MDWGIASVAAITVLAYLAGLIWKAAKLDDRWVPVLCGVVGLALGLLGYFLHIPDFPADDVITAAAVGVVSGFAATGINEMGKQFSYMAAERKAKKAAEAEAKEK